jgi:hypothetical protein
MPSNINNYIVETHLPYTLKATSSNPTIGGVALNIGYIIPSTTTPPHTHNNNNEV